MFKLTSIRHAFVVVALTSTLAACAATTAQNSGFLSSYDGFRPGPEGGVERVWVNPEYAGDAALNAKLSAYTHIIVDPVWVMFKNNEAYGGIDPSQLKLLADDFQKKISGAVQARYRVAKDASPKTLRISFGLTGVESPNRALAAVSTVMPVGLAISFAKKYTLGEHSNVGSASMEVVISDSQSGETIFAAVDRRAGDKDLGTIKDPLNDAKEAFIWWAERLRKTLAKVSR
ncbi:MAG: DUF3313 domain-containing protein [Rhodospirillaceae bacterium]|nr:MAG: DUF3313 domain-containing protein [Rhodospirillaceae bacterium]